MRHELPPIAAKELVAFSETLKTRGYLNTFSDIVRMACPGQPAGKPPSLRRAGALLFTKATVAELLRAEAKLPEDLEATQVTAALGNEELAERLVPMFSVFVKTLVGMLLVYRQREGWDAAIFNQFILACGTTLGELAAEEVLKVLTELQWVEP